MLEQNAPKAEKIYYEGLEEGSRAFDLALQMTRRATGR
jgi:hypothetical protein